VSALTSELGDVLFDVLLLIRVVQRDLSSAINIEACCASACAKLERRAPYVKEGSVAPTLLQAEKHWQQVKRAEKDVEAPLAQSESLAQRKSLAQIQLEVETRAGAASEHRGAKVSTDAQENAHQARRAEESDASIAASSLPDTTPTFSTAALPTASGTTSAPHTELPSSSCPANILEPFAYQSEEAVMKMSACTLRVGHVAAAVETRERSESDESSSSLLGLADWEREYRRGASELSDDAASCSDDDI